MRGGRASSIISGLEVHAFIDGTWAWARHPGQSGCLEQYQGGPGAMAVALPLPSLPSQTPLWAQGPPWGHLPVGPWRWHCHCQHCLAMWRCRSTLVSLNHDATSWTTLTCGGCFPSSNCLSSDNQCIQPLRAKNEQKSRFSLQNQRKTILFQTSKPLKIYAKVKQLLKNKRTSTQQFFSFFSFLTFLIFLTFARTPWGQGEATLPVFILMI